jgi:hypothetical protein
MRFNYNIFIDKIDMILCYLHSSYNGIIELLNNEAEEKEIYNNKIEYVNLEIRDKINYLKKDVNLQKSKELINENLDIYCHKFDICYIINKKITNELIEIEEEFSKHLKNNNNK